LNRRTWTLAVLGVVLLLVVGWWWARRGVESAPRYRTAAVARGTIESTVSATGTVRPVEQVEVGTQVSGTLAKLFADYNSSVRAGQVLAQIEPSSFRARALQAEANVAKAQAALRDAKRQLDRARELVQQKYISQVELDAADVAHEERQADLKQAEASLEVARVDLANTTIRAPIDGVVISRSVNPGQTVAASLQAPQLFIIANDLTRMQVETRIDEADIGRIHPGLRASFTVDAFPEARFQGEVSQVRLEPIIEQNVVTYTTVIRTSNPELKLRPGMTANVTIHVDRRDDVLRVSNAALRFVPAAGRGADTGAAIASTRAGRAGGAGATRSVTAAGAGSADSISRAGRRSVPGGGPGAGSRRAAGAGGDSGVPQGAARDMGFDDVYVLRYGKPVVVAVRVGITDGTFTEVRGDGLSEGDLVIVGLEQTAARGSTMQPPAGLGGRRRP
jgi:HlyD family secretion protein